MGSMSQGPIGTLILLGLLMFIVYRILYTLGGRPVSGAAGGGSVYHLPTSRRPAQGSPPTVKLAPYSGEEDPFADDAQALESHQALIDKGGLNRIGDFTISEVPGYFIRAFTHPSDGIIGMIFKAPGGQVWVSLVTKYKDGRLLTTTSAEKEMVSPSRPHGMPLFNYPGISTEQLLRRHKLQTRGEEKAEAIPPEQFPEFFSENYARLQAHIQEKAGQNYGKTTSPVVPPPLPAHEEFIPTGAQLAKWLIAIYEKIGVPKEKRSIFKKGLVWISRDAGPLSIAQAISEHTGVMIEQVQGNRLIIRSEQGGAEDIVEPRGLKGPALFDKINSCLPEERRFTRLPVNLDSKVTFYSRMSPEW